MNLSDENDEALSEALGSWRPKQYETEQSYERSLYKHLGEQISGEVVEKQITFHKTRADIVVWGDRIIELKNNLNKITQYHRLIGQLEEYSGHSNNIHLVICGELDEAFIPRLREFFKEKDASLTIWKLNGETDSLHLENLTPKSSMGWWAFGILGFILLIAGYFGEVGVK